MSEARVAHAVRELACWAHGLDWREVPQRVADRLRTVAFDVLTVTAIGARTVEQRAIRAVWPTPPGNAPVIGGGTRTDAATAAFLNAQATVCLELDEGNKYAKGHPAAHCFPAILALAAERDATGADTLAALLVGYEVAARFGRATTLRPGTHPHGNWGVAGAAAGCARLLGLDAEGIAAAIDAGSGLPIAGHFGSALDGNPVRNAWLGAANTAGLAAARLAAAGVARNTGTAALSLGELLGGFDPAQLTDQLGARFDVEHNYFKQHASCSYTHPVADLAIAARAELFPAASPAEIAERIAEIRVDTHALAAGLDRPSWDSALGAMFSIPFVAAAALLEGVVSPRPPEQAPELAAVAARVRVAEDAGLTDRLPAHRANRLTVTLADGRSHTSEAENPLGDSDFHPFDRASLTDVLSRHRGPVDAVWRVVDGLSESAAVAGLLGTLEEVR
ncbi:MAG TPA: MmgE/PrpD family protein [Pseudonocardiaceae bacterium]|nr:MmgE/PrpD family protein [Pseudonocardiaceae bacterium]